MGTLVTVVFADVEGSTDMLTGRGDARGLAAIDSVLAEARDRVAAYEGRQVKSLGDGLMLVFPSPRQAVAFAVAVQQALLGRQPRLRIGMNTGEVNGDAADPAGEAVSAAARVAARADGGEILVTDVVRQLVGTMPGVRFTDRGRQRLKGFPERWRLYAATAAARPVGAVPVFGRDRELDDIDWLIDAATAGIGKVLVLTGEAGIGKTHLAEAARLRGEGRGITVLACGADDLERDRPGRLLFAISDALRIDVTALFPESRERGFAIVERIIDAIAERTPTQPTMIVAEDLHWADELSLRGLAAVARRTAILGVGLLATMRPAPQPPTLARFLDIVDRADSRVVRLGPLDDAALAAIVSARWGAPPGRELTRRLHATAGNPLFVVEILRALDDDGLLRIEGGTVDASTQLLPANLRDTVLRRLSALSADCNELLRLASLLGGEFTLTDLATIAGRSVVGVAAHLHEAVDAAVLAGQGDTLSFRHDLIREAVYDAMAPAIRHDLHAAAARSLAASGSPPAQVARHFTLGAREGDPEAAAWLARAAGEAACLAPASAVELYERALEVAPRDWDAAMATEVALLEPLAVAGRVDDARILARRLLDRTDDPNARFQIHRGLGAVLASAGDLAGASAECENAAALEHAPPDQARILRCLSAGQGVLLGRAIDGIVAVVDHELAQGKGDGDSDGDGDGDGDDHLLCVANQTLALAATAQARYDEGLAYAQIASRRFDAASMPRMGFLIPDLWEATLNFCTDRVDEAIRLYELAGREAERRGELILLVHVSVALGAMHFFAGRWDEALIELEMGLAVADETGANAQLVTTNGLLAKIAIGRGDFVAAQSHLTAAHSALASGLHLFGVDVLLWASANLAEANGDRAGALQTLAGLWDQTATLRGLLQYRSIAPDLVRVAVAEGDHGLARAVADEATVLAERSSVASAAATALRCRGLAAADADVLTAAVVAHRATWRRTEHAACCEEAAALLSTDHRRDESIALLDEAAAIHIASGASADLARVDASLRANGRRRRRSPSAAVDRGWASLSPKERDVVDLVAEGLSNPQVGKRLYVSRRTVETHLAHIFRKLEISNRAQLAAAATRTGFGRAGSDGRTDA